MHQPGTSPAPQTAAVRFSVSLPAAQHAMLTAQAAAMGVSLNALIRLVIYDYTHIRMVRRESE